MKVITAPEKFDSSDKIVVFLAGGISNCWNWQEEVIKNIEESGEDTNNLVICNPRRSSFDMANPYEQIRQIEWEFEMLELCDIFSMYFCESESVQPICMYELGRNLLKKENTWICRDKTQTLLMLPISTCITVEKGYPRINDVLIQTKLATKGYVVPTIAPDRQYGVKKHARQILDNYMTLARDYCLGMKEDE